MEFNLFRHWLKETTCRLKFDTSAIDEALSAKRQAKLTKKK